MFVSRMDAVGNVATGVARAVCGPFLLALLLSAIAAEGLSQGTQPSPSPSQSITGPVRPRAPRLRAGSANSADPAAVILSHVAEVRSLTPDRAAQHLPVQVSGVVTAMPGYRNSFFVQDKTGGISVDRTDHAEVHPGDRVKVTGTSGPGLFAPVVLASRVLVLGKHAWPPAPRKTLGDLFGGLEDSQWIELRGVVRSARSHVLFGRPTLLLVLQLDGGTVNLLIQDFAGIEGNRLVDAVIRVRGVCASSGNEKRQFVGSALLVPRASDLTVEQAAPLDPFAGAARPVGDVLKLGQWQHRVRVSGVVTYQIPGEAIYLQDGDDGIRVQTDSPEMASPGTRVEVVGFPAMGEYAPYLEAGSFRILGPGTPVTPAPIEARDVIVWRDGATRGAHDQQLVELQATFLEDHIQGDQRVWILRSGNNEFEARLPISASPAHAQQLAAGSLLRLTGICTLQVGTTLNPVSFSILLRTSRDIVVLKRGPWWTQGRTLVLLAAVAGLAALALLWGVALRYRVEQQTRTIRESEERFRYLSERDALTGLLNRRAILLALDRQIELGRRENRPTTVVLCDIDHFKRVNDVHGHLAGDAALRRFAEAVTGCMRPYDSFGRYGGEEFLIVLGGIPAAAVEGRLHSLHAAVTNLAVRYQQTEFRINCSFGAILVAGEHAELGSESLLAAADQALYRAKNAGRNQVVLQSQVTEFPGSVEAAPSV